MAQHDYILDNGPGASYRNDLNDALLAIASTNLGSKAPETSYRAYAGQLWLDTLAPETLKLRNALNNDWLPVAVGAGFLPQTGGTINGNLAVAGIFHDDIFDAMRVNFAATVAPTAPVLGQLWFDTTTTLGKLKIWNGAWIDVVDLSSPNFFDVVTINSAAGNAQLNLTAAGERRRIVGNQNATRWDFYGLNDVFTGCISDSGDLYLPVLGNWVSAYLNSLQPNIGFTPVEQYASGHLIQIGGNPAHLWINGADQGVIATSLNSGFLSYASIGTFVLVKTLSNVSYNSPVAGSQLTIWPESTPQTGTWVGMDEQIDSRTRTYLFHRIA